MEPYRQYPACSPTSELGNLMYLQDVQDELENIETLIREINELTVRLKAPLSSQHFRLVWTLRDTVERLGLAEQPLQVQHSAGHLNQRD
jgi:hypothetical protein